MGGGGGYSPSDHFGLLKRELELSISNHFIHLRSLYNHIFHKNLISYNPSPGAGRGGMLTT